MKMKFKGVYVLAMEDNSSLMEKLKLAITVTGVPRGRQIFKAVRE